MRTRAFWIGFGLMATGFVRQSTPSGTPIEWKDSCPLLEIGQLATEGPDGEQLHRVIADSIEAWQADGCNRLPFSVGNYTSERSETAFDGHNLVVTRGADYCDDPDHSDADVCLSPNALAITTTYFLNLPGDPRDGELIEVDLEINLRHAFALDGSPDKFDLQSTVTHELGHILGLEHACNTELGGTLIDPAGRTVPSCSTDKIDDTIRSSTMYPYGEPGQISRRTPESDERQAICLVYREHPGTCDLGELEAGCACSGASRGSGSALLVLGALVMILGRRSRIA